MVKVLLIDTAIKGKEMSLILLYPKPPHYMYPHILVVGIFIHGDDGCQKFNKWKLEGGFLYIYIYLYYCE